MDEYNKIFIIKEMNSNKEFTFRILPSYWDGTHVRTGSHIDSTGDGTGTAYDYEENIISKAEPWNGTISDRSPLGEKLIYSKEGDIINVNKYQYLVLKIIVEEKS